MGRPEKASRRAMKPLVHSLFPIGDHGGPQRLLGEAAKRGRVRVETGPRICVNCGMESPMLRCHNRPNPEVPEECGGKTRPRPIRGNRQPRRLGQRTSIPVAGMLEGKRRSLGLDRLPEKIKYRCMARVRHLHLQIGQRFCEKDEKDKWGCRYFIKDFYRSLNPHDYWADGPDNITCYEKGKNFEKGSITYPFMCKKKVN